MDIYELQGIIEASAELTFSRSSGPGGQNVNKRSTQVHARILINNLVILSEDEKQAVRKHLATRINKDDEIVVRVQNSRSQWANRCRAINKLFLLIHTAVTVSQKKKRKPSKPSRAAKEKRLLSKHHRSSIKSQRLFPGAEE